MVARSPRASSRTSAGRPSSSSRVSSAPDHIKGPEPELEGNKTGAVPGVELSGVYETCAEAITSHGGKTRCGIGGGMSTPHLRPPKQIVATEQRALRCWEDGLDTKAIAECLGI